MTRPRPLPLLLAATVVAAACLVAPRARADGPTVTDLEQSSRFHLYFLTGFGGEIEVDDTAFGIDLDPTIGVGARFAIAVHPYVAVGPLVQASFWQVDGFNGDRSTLLDASFFIQGRYAFDAGRSAASIHVLVPVGFTASFANDDVDPDGEVDAGFGWNIGVLFGIEYYLTRSVGLFTELGFMHHGVRHDVSAGDDVKASVNQGRLDVGLTVLL